MIVASGVLLGIQRLALRYSKWSGGRLRAGRAHSRRQRIFFTFELNGQLRFQGGINRMATQRYFSCIWADRQNVRYTCFVEEMKRFCTRQELNPYFDKDHTTRATSQHVLGLTIYSRRRHSNKASRQGFHVFFPGHHQRQGLDVEMWFRKHLNVKLEPRERA